MDRLPPRTFHLPILLLTTTYDAVGNRLVVAPIVVTTITCAGVFYAWLRLRSGSIWPVAIAHNVANTGFDLGAAAAVTGTPVGLAYVAGETGVATLVGVAGVAIWLLTRSTVWSTDLRPTEAASDGDTGLATGAASQLAAASVSGWWEAVRIDRGSAGTDEVVGFQEAWR